MRATIDHNGQDWDAPELGTPKAAAIALLLMALLFGLAMWASTEFKNKPALQAIQVTQASLTSLPQPKPPPPPPPKVVPPPKPLPAVIPKPPPVPSKIVVATKPPPPVRHIVRPPPRPVIHHTVAPPRPTPPQPAVPVHAAPRQPHPAPPAAAPTSGIGPYGQTMHAIIQANQNVPPGISQMGLSGTAFIKIEVPPSGQVIAASIIRSSGNPLIDQTALEHARDAHFPPVQQPDARQRPDFRGAGGN
ncbi:MAG: TonB family protein [Proteobacteria bacterium]|nr:TonB family protein [Pseudomonadota bacterium]